MLRPVWQQAERPNDLSPLRLKSFSQAGSYARKVLCLSWDRQ